MLTVWQAGCMSNLPHFGGQELLCKQLATYTYVRTTRVKGRDYLAAVASSSADLLRYISLARSSLLGQVSVDGLCTLELARNSWRHKIALHTATQRDLTVHIQPYQSRTHMYRPIQHSAWQLFFHMMQSDNSHLLLILTSLNSNLQFISPSKSAFNLHSFPYTLSSDRQSLSFVILTPSFLLFYFSNITAVESLEASQLPAPACVSVKGIRSLFTIDFSPHWQQNQSGHFLLSIQCLSLPCWLQTVSWLLPVWTPFSSWTPLEVLLCLTKFFLFCH